MLIVQGNYGEFLPFRGVGVRGIRVGFGSKIVLQHSIDFTD